MLESQYKLTFSSKSDTEISESIQKRSMNPNFQKIQRYELPRQYGNKNNLPNKKLKKDQ